MTTSLFQPLNSREITFSYLDSSTLVFAMVEVDFLAIGRQQTLRGSAAAEAHSE